MTVTKEDIVDTAVFEVKFIESMEERRAINFRGKLKRRGFNKRGKLYYHPKHWAPVGFGTGEEPDFWVSDEQLKALTTEAKEWSQNGAASTPQ